MKCGEFDENVDKTVLDTGEISESGAIWEVGLGFK